MGWNPLSGFFGSSDDTAPGAAPAPPPGFDTVQQPTQLDDTPPGLIPPAGFDTVEEPVSTPKADARFYPDYITKAAEKHGLDPEVLYRIEGLESGHNPNSKNALGYSGPFQMQPGEFASYGGRGDIFDPYANADAAGAKMADNIKSYKNTYGDDPDGPRQYMMWQQGTSGAFNHLDNPDQPAWQSMYQTGEGQSKGENWAKRAIRGNLPDSLKPQYLTMTSGDFAKVWEAKYNGEGPPQQQAAAGPPPPPDGFDNVVEPAALDTGVPPPPPGFDTVEPAAGAAVAQPAPDGVQDAAQAIEDAYGAAGRQKASNDLSYGQVAKGAVSSGYYNVMQGLRKLMHPTSDIEKMEVEPVDTSNLGKLASTQLPDGYHDPKWWLFQMLQGGTEAAPAIAATAGATAAGAPAAVAAGAGGVYFGLTTVVPAYERAREEGLSHSDAVQRALEEAGISTATGTAMGLAPGLKVLGRAEEGVAKHAIGEALAQIFLVQPTIGAAGQEAGGLVEGRQPSLGEIGTGAAGNVAIGAGFTAAHMLFGTTRQATIDAARPFAEGARARREAAGEMPAAPAEGGDLTPYATDVSQLPPPAPPEGFTKVEPEGGPKSGAPSGEKLAPDRPSAEPIADLVAQAKDLADPKSKRQGLWLPYASLKNVLDSGRASDILSDAGTGIVAEADFDGEGGTLLAKDKATLDKAIAARDAGTPLQEVIGGLVGSGTGKSAKATKVVQQKTPEGAVTRESAVPEADVAATEKEFAAPGRRVETVAPEEALARRVQGVSAEQADHAEEGAPVGVEKVTPAAAQGQGQGQGQGQPFVLPEKPAIPVKKMVSADLRGKLQISSLIDGTRHQDLRPYLAEKGVSMKDYVDHFGIADDQLVSVENGERITAGEAIAAEEQGKRVLPEAGKRESPVELKSGADVKQAAGTAATDYTHAQGEANNRQLGHAKWNGLDISIETDKDGVRRGKNPKTGEEWESKMGSAYGYFKGSVGADNMHVDTFIGPKPEIEHAYVIDEMAKDTGKFRQHKVMIGFANEAAAKNAYTRSGGKRAEDIGAITELSANDLKDWLKNGKLKKPIGSVSKFKYTPEAKPETKPVADGLLEGVSVELSSTRLAREEERIKGGTYKAIARREKPYRVEDGYGNTPEEAKANALRKLADQTPAFEGSKEVKALETQANPKTKSAWRAIGTNADGNPMFEDERGVRSYTENGIRHTEPVMMVPGRGGVGVATKDRTPEFEPVSGQTSLVPEATTKEQIAAQEKKLAAKGRTGDAMDAGMFGSEKDQTDLVDQAKAAPKEREPAPVYAGPDLNAESVNAIVDMWKYAREVHARAKPESLVSYLVAGGGLNDRSRDVRHIAGEAKQRPGLVNKNGSDLDDAALRAWEAGFFPEHSERPTVADFLNALQDDLHTGEVVRAADRGYFDDLHAADAMTRELEDDGIPTRRFRTEGSLRTFLGEIGATQGHGPAGELQSPENEQAVSQPATRAGEASRPDKGGVDAGVQPEPAESKPNSREAAENAGHAQAAEVLKSPGQIAYEDDVARKPAYHDGAKRPAWEKLSPAERSTWDKNPTPREYKQSPLEAVKAKLLDDGFPNIIFARKFVKEAGFEGSAKEMDELIERAIVAAARDIVDAAKDPKKAFSDLVGLYARQPRLASRTSESVSNQAYSTPVPLAYLASRLAGVAEAKSVYEPSAGNGALLVEADPKKQTVYANELDPERAKALKEQGFKTTARDATEPAGLKGKVDSVIANPPFGAVREGGESKEYTIDVGGKPWTTTAIEQAIALRALAQMGPKGKAVLIVGGVTAAKKSPGDLEKLRAGYRAQSKREFYWRLYNNYNVTDHFTVSGDLYERQGAGFPVDVIVIDGQGKSELALPASEPPRIYDDWKELGGLLDVSKNKPAVARGDEQASGALEPRGEPASSDAGRSEANERGGRGELLREPEGKPGAVRGKRGGGEPADVPALAGDARAGGAPVEVRDSGGADYVPVTAERKSRLAKNTNKAGQSVYQPASKTQSVGSLVPVNMADATKDALDRVEERNGQVDHYVGSKLGYEADADGPFFMRDGKKRRPLSAEQIDAISLAIDNLEKANPGALILGDQTGIGKGRVVAGMLRYAMKKGMTPVFVTKEPKLYGDMIRDMTDTGMPEMLGRDPRILMTNAPLSVAVDDAAVESETAYDAWANAKEAAEEAGEPFTEKAPKKTGKYLSFSKRQADAGMKGLLEAMASQPEGARARLDRRPYDMVFTTYDQMNTVKGGETDRRNFVSQITPNAMLVLDEAHEAGGGGPQARGKPKNKDGTPKAANRAEFTRDLVAKAKAVMYSSATYAKRPDVMDLYARTNMGRAVDDPKLLPELIAKGGVPLQQVVATMLSDDGQYIRRERSFDGVDYNLEPVPIDEGLYTKFSDAVRQIFEFDTAVADLRDEYGGKELDKRGYARKKNDQGIGVGAAHSTAFSSIMHNIVGQMLLSIKATPTAEKAIAAWKAGEKPIIGLSNTMESFVKDYADSEGLKAGDILDLDFSSVLGRYLARTLRITVKSPEGKVEHIQIPVDYLGPDTRQKYKAVEALIENTNFGGLPVSPIDWMRHKLTEAGMKVAEITGRQMMIDYGQTPPRIMARPRTEMGATGKAITLGGFNSGTIDAVILNRSGSTGVSMHANATFKDKRPRRMLLAQAEPNIDTHMQMLGRIHRTGQVELPRYSQVVADIPAEARPTAILMRKMASLNAATTASRKSVFMSEAVDFLNEYGDKVVIQELANDPMLNRRLGNLLKLGQENEKPDLSDIARKATGRLVLLPPKEQSEFLDRVTSGYKELIDHLNQTGENALEASTVDLQARPLDSQELKPRTGDSVFLAPVKLERVSAKAQGKAMEPSEIAEAVAETLGKKASGEPADSIKALRADGREFMAKKYQETEERYRGYVDMALGTLDLEGGKEDSKATLRKNLEDDFQKFKKLASVAQPGAVVRLDLGENGGTVDGVVTAVARSGKAKNPAALSAWRVTVAVPTPDRAFVMPMSMLYPPGHAMLEGEKGTKIEPSQMPLGQLLPKYDEARKSGREDRYVITGNILAGYDQTGGGGQVVNYTLEDGSTKPGILLPRGFKKDDFLNKRAIRLLSGREVGAFIDQVPAETAVRSKDGLVTLTRTGSGAYVISMPAGRGTGGKYFTEQAVRDAVAPAVFAKQGNDMTVRISDRTKFVKAADAMAKLGALFETREHQEIATKVASGAKRYAYAEAVSPLLGDVSRRLQKGETVDLREQAHAMRKLIARTPSVVPETIPEAVVEQIEPFGDYHYKVTAGAKNGERVEFYATLDDIRNTAALFDVFPDGSPAIVYFSLESLGSVVDRLKGYRAHEGLHGLRAVGLLPGTPAEETSLWGRLVKHASVLRPLDLTPRKFGEIIGHPEAQRYSDRIKIGDAYRKLYEKFRDRQSAIDEESVAHMIQLYVQGHYSDQDIAPVKDIVSRILSGEIARRGAPDPRVDQRAEAFAAALSGPRRSFLSGRIIPFRDRLKAWKLEKQFPDEISAAAPGGRLRYADEATLGHVRDQIGITNELNLELYRMAEDTLLKADPRLAELRDANGKGLGAYSDADLALPQYRAKIRNDFDRISIRKYADQNPIIEKLKEQLRRGEDAWQDLQRLLSQADSVLHMRDIAADNARGGDTQVRLGSDETLAPELANANAPVGSYEHSIERNGNIKGNAQWLRLTTPGTVIEFFDRFMQPDDGAAISVAGAYKAYFDWATEQGKKPVTAKEFEGGANDLGVMRAHIAGTRRFIGLRLETQDGEGHHEVSLLEGKYKLVADRNGLGQINGEMFDKKGRNVGHVYVRTHPQAIQLGQLHVDPGHQRKGLATAVQNALERIAGKPAVPDYAISAAEYGRWKKYDPAAVADYQNGKGDFFYTPSMMSPAYFAAQGGDPVPGSKAALALREGPMRSYAPEETPHLGRRPINHALGDHDQATRRLIEQRLIDGHAVRIPPRVVESVLAAVRPHLDMVPEGTHVAAITKIEPRTPTADNPYDIIAHFATADGVESSVDANWTDLAGSRAFTTPDGRIIGFLRLSLPREVVSAHGFEGRGKMHIGAGVVAHEVVHALRLGGGIPDGLWRRLVDHATVLQLLDMDTRTYYQRLRVPSYQKVAPGKTIRSRYEEIYAGTADLQERLDHEAVAILAELAADGALSSYQLAMVAEDLRQALGGTHRFKASDRRGGPLFALAPKTEKEFDQHGLYDNALEAVKAVTQEKGTVEQLRSQIVKAGGAGTEKALEAAGFDKAFPDPRVKVSRAEIEQFLRKNRVWLGETRYGEKVRAKNVEIVPHPAGSGFAIKNWMGNYVGNPTRKFASEADADAFLEANKEVEHRTRFGGEGGALRLETPGGIPGSYREVVTTLPTKRGLSEDERYTLRRRLMDDQGMRDYEADEYINRLGTRQQSAPAEYTGDDSVIREMSDRLKASHPSNEYTSSHWPGITNPLVHYRVKDFANSLSREGVAPAGVEKVTPPSQQVRRQPDRTVGATDASSSLNQTKTRVLDELQSDWAQRARDQGTRDPVKAQALQSELEQAKTEHADYDKQIKKIETDTIAMNLDPNMPFDIEKVLNYPADPRAKKLAGMRDEIMALKAKRQDSGNRIMDLSNKVNAAMHDGVPSAPFIGNTSDWVDLGLKQALSEAAKDPSVTRFAWAPGGVQVERYNLSHHVDSIAVVPGKGTAGKGIHGPDGDAVPFEYSFWPKSKGGSWDLGALRTDAAGKIVHADSRWGDVVGNDIREVIGRDAAEKGLAMTTEGKLSGLDFTTGGEGMRSFYGDFDKSGSYTPGIVGTRLLKLVKSLDPEAAKIEAHEPELRSERDRNLRQNPNLPPYKNPIYPSIPITPKLRAAILKGLPLFGGSGRERFAAAIPREHPRTLGLPATVDPIISSFTDPAQIKAHPDYVAAKAGDVEAAARLVADLVKDDDVREAFRRFGDEARYLAVLAEEATGKNAIPQMLAAYYAEAISAVHASDVLQASASYHTGARPLERIISRPLFAGEIVPQGKYVLVDDVTVMGTTLAELANYVRAQGGEVAGVVTLVNASRTGLYTPRANQIRQIEGRHGSLLRDELGLEPSALTAPEAGYLLNYRHADALRDGIVKAKGDRERRLRTKGLRPPEEDGGGRLGSTFAPAITPAKAAELQKGLQAAVDQALGIVARIAGRGVKVELSDHIPAQGLGTQSPEELRALGAHLTDTVGGYYQPVSDGALDGRALIWLATNDPSFNLADTAGHEAWHHVKEKLATEAEKKLLSSPSEQARMRKYAAPEIGLEPDDVRMESLDPREVEAYAFQRYRREQDAGNPQAGSGLHMAIRKLFDRILEVLRRVKNALNGLGYKSYEDIFENARTGEYADRTPAEIARLNRLRTFGELGAKTSELKKAIVRGTFPDSVRAAIAATGATGRAMAYDQQGHPDKAANMRRWRDEVLSGDRALRSRSFEDDGLAPETFAARYPRTPAEEAVGEQIVRGVKRTWELGSMRELSDNARDRFTKVYAAAKDNLYPIKRMEDVMAGDNLLKNDPDKSAYMLMRLTRGNRGRSEAFIMDGAYRFSDMEKIGPGLKEIIDGYRDKGGDDEGFEIYAVSKRALEYERRGLESGVDTAQAREVIAQGTEKYDQAFRQSVRWNQQMLAYMRDSGVISNEAYVRMTEENKDYTPFYRLRGDEEFDGHPTQSRGMRVRQPIRRVKGGTQQIVSPLESMVKNAFLFIDIAEKNRSLLQLKKIWKESGDIGKQFMQKVKQTVRPITVTEPEVGKFLSDQGIDADPEAFTIFRPNAFNPGPDEIALYDNGKKEIYKVGDDVAKAIKGLTPGGADVLTKIMKKPASWLRAGAILAPEFAERNPIRDQFSALVFSNNGYVPVWDFMKGLGTLWNRGEEWANWMKSGGAGAAMVAIDRNYINDNLIRLDAKSKADYARQIVKSPVEALRIFSEAMENATRLGEFLRAQKNDKSLFESGFDTREVTLDFGRSGDIGQVINQWIPFFNAQVEGVDRAARAFKDNPMRFMLKTLGSISLLSFLTWLWNHKDKRWYEIPNWEKDIYWVWMTDKWTDITPDQADNLVDDPTYKRHIGGQWQQNMGEPIRFPKPFELGVMFGSAFERALSAYFDANPHAYKDLASSISQALLPGYLPTAVTPLLEQWANKSFFLDRPLVPKAQEHVIAKYQETPYTSSTAKLIAQGLSKIAGDASSFASPIIVDNYIREWGGGLGQHLLGVADAGLHEAGYDVPKGAAPTSKWADEPFVKAFVARYPSASSQSVQDFYDTYEQRVEAKATAAYLKKSGRADEVPSDEAMGNATAVHKALGVASKLIRDITRDPKMTSDDKRQLIDATYLHMIELAQQGNQFFAQTEHQGAAKKHAAE